MRFVDCVKRRRCLMLLLAVYVIFQVCLNLSRKECGAEESESGDGRRRNCVTSSNDNHVIQACTRIHRPRDDGDVRYRNDHWQVQEDKESDEELVLYSAFYDDRTLTQPNASAQIRILGVRKIKEPERDIFCFIWLPTKLRPVVTKATVHVTGRDYLFAHNNLAYGQRLFSCALNNALLEGGDAETTEPGPEVVFPRAKTHRPLYVSLSTQICPENLTNLLPVKEPETEAQSQFPHTFGVCVAISFGNLATDEELVEWFEANMLFGVTEFNVYNGSIDPSKNVVLDYYSRTRRVLRVHQMPPSVDDFTENGIKLSSPASLNDCMMNNMHRYRYVLVIDFDELVVPGIHSNYSQMLNDLNRNLDPSELYHTYLFQMAYFFLSFPEDTSEPDFLKTMRFRFRTAPGGPKFGAKSFVDPRKCLSLFNHYCWIPLSRQETKKLTLGVNYMVAMTHHYRKSCPFDERKCSVYNAEKRKDMTMNRFKESLTERVSLTLRDIDARHTAVTQKSTSN